MNDPLLEKLVQLQEEQNQLLRKHLTRIRFSLWSLLVLTTLMGVLLGLGVYLTRPQSGPTTMTLAIPPIYNSAPVKPPAMPQRYDLIK